MTLAARLAPLAALALFACTAPPAPTPASPAPSGPAPAEAPSATPTLPPTPTPPAPTALGGLDFRPLDEAALAILEHDLAISPFVNASLWRANQSQGSVNALDPGNWSGNYAWWLDPGEFIAPELPGPGCSTRRHAPVSMLAARTPAFRGDFTTVVTRDLRPIVDAWAPDAVFANVRPNYAPRFGLVAFSDEDLRPVALHHWPVRFGSPARRETLTFYQSPRSLGGGGPADAPVVLALLTRWEPCGEPDPASVPIGRAAATRRLAAAMADPAAASVEERTGRDYFLGLPYPQAPVRREPASPGPRAGTPDFSGACVDEAAVELRHWFGRRVWFVSAYATWYVGKPASCAPAEDSAFVRYGLGGGLSGLVDADSGAVIRFYRAMRYDRDPPWPEGPMASAPAP